MLGFNKTNPIIKTEEYINGVAKFKKQDGTRGYIKKSGSILIDGLGWSRDFREDGIAEFSRPDETWGRIRMDGTIIAEGFKFVDYFIDGVARFVRQDGTMGRIRMDGTIVADGFWSIENGFIGGITNKFVREDGTKGWIRIDGTIIAEGFKYMWISGDGKYIDYEKEDGTSSGLMKEDGTILVESYKKKYKIKYVACKNIHREIYIVFDKNGDERYYCVNRGNGTVSNEFLYIDTKEVNGFVKMKDIYGSEGRLNLNDFSVKY